MESLEYELMEVKSSLGASVSASRDYALPKFVRRESKYRSKIEGMKLDRIRKEIRESD